MNDVGKISVIVPVYCAEKFIRQTMASLLVQTYQNFEIIVIDDCPSDNTVKIIEEFMDERITVLHNEKNMGVCKSRNRGIEASSGDFVVFFDHDDIAPAEKLEKQVLFLDENRSIDAVGGRIQDIDGEGNHIGTFNPVVLNNPKYIRAVLLFGGVFINSSVMYRTDIIKKNNIFFREKSYGLEDYLFLLEVSKKGDVSGINDDVLFYRRYEGNTEKKILQTQKDLRDARFGEIRKFAFEAEGFSMTDEDFALVNKIFVENPVGHALKLSFSDISDCCILFEKLLTQADELKLPNKNELQIAFRKFLSGRMVFIK